MNLKTIVKSAIISAALSAAVAIPAKAQYLVDTHVEQQGDGTVNTRAELASRNGSWWLFRSERSERNDTAGYRLALNLPVGNGFVSAYAQEQNGITGLGSKWNVGARNLQLGGELETRANESAGGLYGIVRTSNVLVAVGAGNKSGLPYEHGVFFANAGNYTLGGGMTHVAGIPNQYHAVLGRYPATRGEELGFVLQTQFDSQKASASLLLATNANFTADDIIRPHSAFKSLHAGNMQLVSDLNDPVVTPGKPSHTWTDAGGTVQLTYTNNHGSQNLAIDARVLATGKLHTGNLVDRIVIGGRYETATRAFTPLADIVIGPLDIYVEKTPGQHMYGFAGIYLPVKLTN